MTQQEKSAGCIVFYRRDEKSRPLFLVVKDRVHRNWGFPKGHVEQNESEKETAIRETKEETGLDVRILDGFREEIVYRLSNGKMKTAVYFLAESDTRDVKLQDEEMEAYAWLTFYEAIGRVTFVDTALLIEKARDFIK